MKSRKNRSFKDTEAYMLLQNNVTFPKNIVFSYKSVDAFLRKKLGLNNVSFLEVGENNAISLFVNKKDDVNGYSAYNDTLYLNELNVDDDGIDGYDFLIKDYCKEWEAIYGIIYVDDWNRIFLRLGPVTSKYQIQEAAEFYSHMYKNWHGKCQIGLDWDIIRPEKWVWNTNEINDLSMIERYDKCCEIFDKKAK